MNAPQPPVQTKAEVIERLQQQQAQLRALGVARLGLFGSFVRDEARPNKVGYRNVYNLALGSLESITDRIVIVLIY